MRYEKQGVAYYLKSFYLQHVLDGVASFEATDARWRLLDAQGRLIFQSEAGGLTTIPSQGLANGLYFVEVWDGEKRWAGRFLIGF